MAAIWVAIKGQNEDERGMGYESIRGMNNLLRRTWRILFFLLLTVAPPAAGDPGPAADSDPLRVLFVGNSYTFFNDLPRLVERLAEAAGGRPIETAQAVRGGARLEDHWESSQVRQAIESGDWDFVVLQSQSRFGMPRLADGAGEPIPPESFHHHARLLDGLIREQGARTIFFLQWKRRDAPRADQRAITVGHHKIASELGALVSPVGLAWQQVRLEHPEIDLYDPDGSHPGPAGSYLAACVFYAVLLGETPVGLPTVESVEAETAVRLQQMAWAVTSRDTHTVDKAQR
jgi:hypothetical protein